LAGGVKRKYMFLLARQYFGMLESIDLSDSWRWLLKRKVVVSEFVFCEKWDEVAELLL
jgi:hypothetical protein